VTILRGLREAVLTASERLVNAAAQECRLMTAEAAPAPETGTLNRSIVATPAENHGATFTARIVASAPYASYTDEGTGVYVGRGRIYPRQARALVFFWIAGPNGAGVYAFRSVAGQPGQHWFAQPMPERWTAALEAALARGALST
jgi:hypothetical protein